jgi:hypothetical protein
MQLALKIVDIWTKLNHELLIAPLWISALVSMSMLNKDWQILITSLDYNFTTTNMHHSCQCVCSGIAWC